MADMLTIGTLATNTFKRALDVTSHNIANVGTDGYSRQRADIVSNSPSITGATFLGGGSTVSTIERIAEDYIQRQLYTSQTSVSRYETSYSLAKQVEGVVAGNDQGVQEFMQRVFDSLQTVASNPTSSPTRQMLLDEFGNLSSHVNNLSAVFDDIQTQTNSQITDLSKEINNRLGIIHEINNQVERAMATGTQLPNDLLDQRDQAILELSEYIDVQTFPQEDGSVELYTAGGKLPLINDNTLTNISVASGPYSDENRVEVYATIGGEKRVISDMVTGGQLGGVLDFRSEMLDRAQSDLGVTLNGMVASMNWQNYQGWDINGDAGGNLFMPLDAKVMNSSTNNSRSDDGSGISVTFNPAPPNAATVAPPYTLSQPETYGEKNAAFEQAIADIGQFESREYELRYNSSTDQFDVYDRKTSESLGSFNRDGNPPVTIDGLEFKGDGGNYADGDQFLVKPHQDILENFETVISDPDLLATRGQSPLADDYNAAWDDDGDGNITYTEFLANSGADTSGDGQLSAAEITAALGTTPSGNNLGDIMDANGDGTISVDEFSLLLASKPSAAAEGDNTNIANMASLQSKEILYSDGNGRASATLLGGYSQMSGNVGLYVRSNEIQLTAQENVLQQVVDRRESLSGVSLDEEAANLLRYQQAYEASAQIISTSQSLFQTLLGVVRG